MALSDSNQIKWEYAVEEALIKTLSASILEFLCNARNGKGNSELFQKSHDKAAHTNSYISRPYE